MFNSDQKFETQSGTGWRFSSLTKYSSSWNRSWEPIQQSPLVILVRFKSFLFHWSIFRQIYVLVLYVIIIFGKMSIRNGFLSAKPQMSSFTRTLVNILQWNKNYIKSTRMTTGDYSGTLKGLMKSDLFLLRGDPEIFAE